MGGVVVVVWLDWSRGVGKKLLKGGFLGLTHQTLPPSANLSIFNIPSSFSSPIHLIHFSEGVSRVFP